MNQTPLILVCDDAKPIGQTMVRFLKAAGYRAKWAPNALDCVGQARHERPALILMDIMMPGMDGAMVSEIMNQYPELSGIPVILVSAMPEEQVRAKAHDSGAVDYVCKPFKKDTLLSSVRRWVAEPVPAIAS
jgi:CheY-like chemotaxis protein